MKVWVAPSQTCREEGGCLCKNQATRMRYVTHLRGFVPITRHQTALIVSNCEPEGWRRGGGGRGGGGGGGIPGRA